MALSQVEKQFFQHHKIDEQMLFDAKGNSLTKGIEEEMRALKKAFAYNTAPCNNGHTLKSRSGHCIVCNTAVIKFMKDSIAWGAVYIAGSVAGEMVKVGFTENIESRKVKLNTTKYGGQNDWEIILHANCYDGGKVEKSIQSELSKYAIKEKYAHDGSIHDASELFKCSYQKAKEVLLNVQVKENIELIDLTERNLIVKRYGFRNLAKAK